MDHFANSFGDSYDRVAPAYAARIADELRGKPLDRMLLARLAEDARGKGSICDVGCGPGHVARFLADTGANVIASDISFGMLREAVVIAPDAPRTAADMRQLPFADHSLAGVCALYSVIHLLPNERPHAFSEFHRVLRMGGVALVAFHIGDEVLHLADWWGIPVSVDFRFLRTEVIAAEMRATGFAIEDEIERAPYPDIEHASRRGYLYAHRTA
ncbi:MAG: class I SAM-dependent methyltransferase [Thermoflexales bacterium]